MKIDQAHNTGAGESTGTETADVALMKDDLRKLPEFIELSRRVGGVLKANIAFAIGTKAIFVVLAFTGHASLWLAILADMGASLAVVFNGLRLSGATQRSSTSSTSGSTKGSSRRTLRRLLMIPLSPG